jgi:hypothetical protein
MILARRKTSWVVWNFLTVDVFPFTPTVAPVVSCFRMDPDTGILAIDTAIGVGGLVTCTKTPTIQDGSWYASIFTGNAGFERYVLVAAYRNAADTSDMRQTEQLYLSDELLTISEMETSFPSSIVTTLFKAGT